MFQARVHTVLLEELAHPSAFTRPFLEHIPRKGVRVPLSSCEDTSHRLLNLVALNGPAS